MVPQDCTNEMQIQYYQSHYTEYVKDALLDYKQKIKHFEKLDNQMEEFISPSTVVSASTTSSSLFVSYQEFYIKRLDTLDLFREYTKWQQMGKTEIRWLLALEINFNKVLLKKF